MKTFQDFMKEQTLVDTGSTEKNLSRMLRMLDTLEPKDIADNMSSLRMLDNKLQDILSGKS